MLEIEECSASFGNTRVFQNISLSLNPGETVAVLGPSGCGKSTLLSLIAGLKRADTGRVRLDGADVKAGDRRISLVLQNYGLFPWMTVRKNAELGLRIRGETKKNGDRIDRLFGSLGIEGLGERYPGQLSGGQRQRVALARSLAVEPRLLLMDEPFSALDALTRETLQDLLLSILEEREIITLIVTHSIEEAVYLGDRVYIMGSGPNEGFSGPFPVPDKERISRTSDLFFDSCRSIRSAMRYSR